MDQLKEVALPIPVSWLPQTPGWYVLAVLLLIGIVWSIVRYLRYRRLNRYRQEALVELKLIKDRGRVNELPVLVKRVALQIAPRMQVASLSGDAWLSFLDQSYGGTGFSKGAGRVLPVIAYQGPERITDQQTQSLCDLVAEWIRRHRARV